LTSSHRTAQRLYGQVVRTGSGSSPLVRPGKHEPAPVPEEVPLALERGQVEYVHTSISDDGFVGVRGPKDAVLIKVSADKDAVFNWRAVVARRGREDDLIEEARLVGSGDSDEVGKIDSVIASYERIVDGLPIDRWRPNFGDDLAPRRNQCQKPDVRRHCRGKTHSNRQEENQ
jgi:hypothetical protein